MTLKFKVGDRVRFNKTVDSFQCGDVAEITIVDEGDRQWPYRIIRAGKDKHTSAMVDYTWVGDEDIETFEFRVGDIVLVRGRIEIVSPLRIKVRLDNHNYTGYFDENELTYISSGKLVPLGTIVDSIEGKFVFGTVLNRPAWIKLEVGPKDPNCYYLDHDKGKILTNLAKEDLAK